MSDATSKGKTKQPEWRTPSSQTPEPVLKVYNSMTKTKNEFIPMHGRHVKWYNCGPTVYDASHLGHARNYVTQDIIRRILTNYFGYDVQFVMNITDIDDKIIQRARQTHLTTQLREKSISLTPELLVEVQSAFAYYVQSKLGSGALLKEDIPSTGTEESAWPAIAEKAAKDLNWVKGCVERDEKFSMHITSLNSAYQGILAAKANLSDSNTSQTESAALIDSSLDVLGPWLDTKHKASINDHSIFRALSSYWEDAFMADMAQLRVQPPDVLTRVTEYVPEIASFVERIIQNGYAYATDDGNVWFDTKAFDGGRLSAEGEDDWKHTYAKLNPWNKGNKELLEEGEGALTSGAGKRTAADFALWKASKPGEPAWPSPWGPGRPGWHIECSVMATEILGDNMDIHSGGIDLAFPHHDNELAQSEAYHDCRQWVNYFIHTGHLHIEGLKMSKSLKNFITIGDALKVYTARQLRLVFLGQLWSAKMDFRESAIIETKALEATFDNFFNITKALVAESEARGALSDSRHHFDAPERELSETLKQTQHDFRVSLCDSFNTPEALAHLTQLVSRTNVYIARGRSSINIGVVKNIAVWVTKMLRMFGLGEGVVNSSATTGAALIGWGNASTNEAEGGAFDREAVLMPYLRVLSTFRDEVRQLAIAQAPANDILARSDRLRDIDLAPLGVALDDQDDGKALVKLVDPAILLRAREEKERAVAEKARKKAAQVEAELAKKRAKMEKGKVAPSEMFKPPNVAEGAYRSWNDDGIPLTDGQGVELPKSKGKKLAKEWEGQKKLHAEWLEWSKTNTV